MEACDGVGAQGDPAVVWVSGDAGWGECGGAVFVFGWAGVSCPFLEKRIKKTFICLGRMIGRELANGSKFLKFGL